VGVLAAVATAVSTRLSPAASVGVSLGVFLVGHLTVFLEAGVRGSAGAGQLARQGVLAVVPFLEIFNLNEKLSHAMLTPLAAGSAGAAEWLAVWEYVGWSGLYALAYVAFAIGLGALLFRRRSLG